MNLTIDELVHHLDITSTDPMVRQLVELLQTRDITLYRELINAGMDPKDCTFSDSVDELSPSEYIDHLRSDASYYKNEYDDMSAKLDAAEHTIKHLSARSIASVLEEMERQVKKAESNSSQMTRDCRAMQSKIEKLESQLTMWKVLEN